MVNGWLIALGLINAYIVLLVWLVRSGRMEKYNLSLLLGFILMIRTQRGRDLLAKISRPKRFWNLFGDIGVVVTFLGMFGITAAFLALLPRVLSPENTAPPLGASEILVIPGVNPFVPLWYGIISLIVTLVVHEGGHGVLALANKMRLKSLGLLYAVVPIGAFVEPDEQDLTESPRRSRLRVYAAGPAVNFAVAGIVLALLAVTAGAAAPLDGVHVGQVTEDGPADLVGIRPGGILLSANGQPLEDWGAFTAFMENRTPQEEVTFVAADGGVHVVNLTSRWQAYEGEHFAAPQYSHLLIQPSILEENEAGQELCNGFDSLFRQRFGANHTSGADCAEKLDALPLVGIGQFPTRGAQALMTDPFGSGIRFLQLTFLPLQEVRGDPILSAMPHFFDTPFDTDAYWITVNVLFWIFWMNLMVGLTNILPMLPLDGGHLFRDGMGGIMEKLRPNATPEARDRLVGRIAGTMSLVILVAFLLQIFGPRLVQAFA